MSQSAQKFAIVGDGAAGINAALQIRATQPMAEISIVSSDPQPFYYRASLTNYLLGNLKDEELWGLPPNAWDELNLKRIHAQAKSLDSQSQVLHVQGHEPLRYDRLLIASGARARTISPEVSGASVKGIMTLRSVRDVRSIIDRASRAQSVVVIGGGILGIEVCEGLHSRRKDLNLTLLHRGPQLLERVVDRRGAELIQLRMQRDGINVVKNAETAGFDEREGAISAVILEDGSRIPCDCVVACIGVVPNTEWLKNSGITLSRGHVVTETSMRVKDVESVWAAGDVAHVIDENLPFHNPSGLWQPAQKQGEIAGQNMTIADHGNVIDYRPGAILNATKAWNLDLVSCGEKVDGEGEIVRFDSHESGQTNYKCALIRDSRIAGFMLLGNRREAHALHRLMNLRGRAGDVSSIKDRLFDTSFDLFGWVAAQEKQPGTSRWDAPSIVARGPLPSALETFEPIRQRALSHSLEVDAFDLEEDSPPLSLEDSHGITSFTKGPVRIGGSAESDICIRSMSGQRGLLELRPAGAGWLASVTDRSMQAYRNGIPVTQPTFIADLDVLQVGIWKAQVRLEGSEARRTESMEMRPSAQLMGTANHEVSGQFTRIGSSSDNHIVLDGKSVDRFHAQIILSGTDWYIVDAGSDAGTEVNGQPVSAPRRLADNDTVSIGETKLIFRLSDRSAEKVHQDTTTKQIGGPDFYLVCLEGVIAPRALSLSLPCRVGSGDQADAIIDDPLVSRLHTLFQRNGDKVSATDLGSTNGTLVGDKSLPPGMPRSLKENELVRIGGNSFRFQTSRPTTALFDPAKMASTGRRAATKTFNVNDFIDAQEQRRTVAILTPVTKLSGLDIGSALLEGAGPFILGNPREEFQYDGEGDYHSFPLTTISREHAQITVENDRYFIEDLSSLNGTRVNGQTVSSAKQPLNEGDVISLHLLDLAFRIQHEVTTESIEVGGAGEQPEYDANCYLSPVDGLPGSFVDQIELRGSGPHVVGRSRSTCDITLPFHTVSDRHAEIEFDGNSYRVRDLGSRNGTFVNGVQTDRGSISLAEDDVVSFHVFRFRFSRAPAKTKQAEKPTSAKTFAVNWSPGQSLDSDKLSEVVNAELDACIGCHLCMNACPLPESNSVTIGALNAYAAGVGDPSAEVKEFVQACTQCHACVPVCPAAIERSRLVLWNKFKEIPDGNERVTAQLGDSQVRLALTYAELARDLVVHPWLGILSEAERLALLGQSRYRQLVPGETLISEGEYIDALWLLLDGDLDIGVSVTGNDFQQTVSLVPGQTVGEFALLADQPSDTAVRAGSAATVIGFSRYTLNFYADKNAEFSANLDSLYLGRSMDALLRNAPVLESLSEKDRRHILDMANAERYSQGDRVLDASQAGDTLAFVARGFIREVRTLDGREIVSNYLTPGDVFGVTDSQRRGEVAYFDALTLSEVFTVSVDALSRSGDHWARWISNVGETSVGSVDYIADRAESAGIDAAIKAHELLVIDTTRCVDCDNCVSACRRRHGHARFDRRGSDVQIGKYQIPSSCFHCEDPLCLLCSVDGIVREPSGEIRIKEENCIGCAACAERCPYDNIKMVPRDPNSGSTGVLERLLPNLFQPRNSTQLSDMLAVKCDLCQGYEDGPACVRSCPTDAAQRVDPLELFSKRGQS